MPVGPVIYKVADGLYVSEDGALHWSRPGVTVVGDAQSEAETAAMSSPRKLLGGDGDGPVTAALGRSAIDYTTVQTAIRLRRPPNRPDTMPVDGDSTSGSGCQSGRSGR
jgi:hypothetical protein